MTFYSARLLFIILINDGRPRKRNDYDESIVVFRSRNGKAAISRAVSIGRSMETEYKNKYGQEVRWALVQVESIREIGGNIDNQEVSSKLYTRLSKRTIPFKHQFAPEKSKPELYGNSV